MEAIRYAKRLFNLYYQYKGITVNVAKCCAKTCVEEILEAVDTIYKPAEDKVIDYWEEVIEEIDKIQINE